MPMSRRLNVVAEAKIRSVPCERPTCQAQPGEFCRDRTGVLRPAHAQRWSRWQWGPEHPERDEPCPQCAAKPGEPCQTSEGQPREKAHTGRYRKAGFRLKPASAS
jgi:hypothetical protein